MSSLRFARTEHRRESCLGYQDLLDIASITLDRVPLLDVFRLNHNHIISNEMNRR
jgi:hypothetical protein